MNRGFKIIEGSKSFKDVDNHERGNYDVDNHERGNYLYFLCFKVMPI